MLSSSVILERFRRSHATDIDLTLRPAYLDLLAGLGDPHKKLPPVFHVAGTNGKGSVCAFLRAMLEAAGYTAHVYTSPHLVTFHERIRIAGELIGENELAELLGECEKFAAPGAISVFEAGTAAALAAFARHKADFTILETGLGGRLDATNVVEKPLATVITRLSYDHREFLGDTLAQIAGEKAGIMKHGVPCFVAAQPDRESIDTLRAAARAKGCPLHVGDEDWHVAPRGEGLHFSDRTRTFDLPPPALLGAHQFKNAGLAIAALSVVTPPLAPDAIAHGLQNAEWPARLQRLETGVLPALLPPGWELWLDGGHNDSAGEALAEQAGSWGARDGLRPRPLHLVFGMLKTKRPGEFLAHLKPHVAAVRAVTIPGEAQSFTAEELAREAQAAGIGNTRAMPSLEDALTDLARTSPPGRILICGSLYLAGHVLKENGN